MLKIINKTRQDNLFYPGNHIEIINDEAINETKLHYECEDGVSFDKEITGTTVLFDGCIPKGMAGQIYHIYLNSKKTEEVILKVEKDIFYLAFSYQNKETNIRCFDQVYENKRYINLNDLSLLLKESDKAFSYERTGSNKLFINQIERRYFTTKEQDEVYIFIVDAMLATNTLFINKDNKEINIEVVDFDSNILEVFPNLIKNNYFGYLHGAIIGDMDSGEVFYQVNSNIPSAIASTSKLLTLYLVMDEIKKGNLTYETLIQIPEEAERESLSEDGTVYLEKGKEVPLFEMLEALMLPSSNEAAIALGCKIAGSEKEFANKMNEICEKLKLKMSHFFNASGLPYYNQSLMPAKLQNRMTASELYTLASSLVQTHPEVLEITSLKRAYLKTLDVTLTNTNPLLFNLDTCVGLKTGTTNRAGCCLVSLNKVQNRRILCVILGAESSQERGEKSELLQRYVKALINCR